MKTKIRFYPGGGVRKLHTTRDLEVYGAKSRKRASHVEPVNPVLRWLFRCLRAATHHREGAVAAFTRRWPCDWQATIIAGPTLGPFRTRKEAIEAEVAWLVVNFVLQGTNSTDL